jgi:hypothetical protein
MIASSFPSTKSKLIRLSEELRIPISQVLSELLHYEYNYGWRPWRGDTDRDKKRTENNIATLLKLGKELQVKDSILTGM